MIKEKGKKKRKIMLYGSVGEEKNKVNNKTFVHRLNHVFFLFCFFFCFSFFSLIALFCVFYLILFLRLLDADQKAKMGSMS